MDNKLTFSDKKEYGPNMIALFNYNRSIVARNLFNNLWKKKNVGHDFVVYTLSLETELAVFLVQTGSPAQAD